MVGQNHVEDFEKNVFPAMLPEMLTLVYILAQNHGNELFKSSLSGDISDGNNLK